MTYDIQGPLNLKTHYRCFACGAEPLRRDEACPRCFPPALDAGFELGSVVVDIAEAVIDAVDAVTD